MTAGVGAPTVIRNSLSFPERRPVQRLDLSSIIRSREVYFLWLKDKTARIRLENEIIIIIVSKTVIGITPFQTGLADHP